MITAAEILSLIYKAQRIGASPTIIQNDDGYKLDFHYDWHNSDRYSRKEIFITNEGESTWEKGDYDFWTMDSILDEKLNEQLQREIKAKKRKELIESLTPEQRELLDL
jgi:hypothetical protein